MLKAFTLAVGLLAMPVAAPVAEAAQIYICRIQDHGNSGWIPEILFIGREEGAGTAVVSDPLILYFNDRRPVRASIVADNPRRITFVWSIAASTRIGQRVSRMEFSATYLKAARRMLVAATPIGYSSHFSGEGTCKVEER